MSTISANQLKPGTTIIVKGKVTYSHITKFVEGEELKKENQRRASRGQIQANRPYTTIAITEAQIVPVTIGTKTLEEQYVENKFYTRQDTPNIYNYQYENKSPYLPRVCQAREGVPNTYDQIVPEGELANGLEVMLLLSVYQAKNYGGNIGLGLDQIIVCEKVRYYTGGGVSDAMAKHGMNYNPLPPEEDRKAVMPKEPVAQPAASPVPAMPDPAANPYQYTPAQNPAPVQTAPTPVATQPTPPAQPAPAMNPPEPQAPASPWTCPVCGTVVAANMGFCGSCGTKKPEENNAQAPNPYAGNNAGLRYEPN